MVIKMIKLSSNPIVKKIWEKFGFNIFILMGVLGVMLISLSELPKEKTDETAQAYSADEYRKNMEEDLTRLLSAVNGAGQVQVMITLESGEETVYAWQEKTSDDVQKQDGESTTQRTTYENEVVMVSAGSDKQALVEKTMQPAVQGVVVVCRGADDIQVVSDITNAVSVALNVPTNRVCVIKMQ